MTTLITGAGMIGSLAAARIVEERSERPVLYDIAFSEQNLSERLESGSVELVKGDIGDIGDLIAGHRGPRSRPHHPHRLAAHPGPVIPRPVAGSEGQPDGHPQRAGGGPPGRRCPGWSSAAPPWSPWAAAACAPEDDTVEDFALNVVSEYPPSLYASMKLASEWLCHNYTGLLRDRDRGRCASAASSDPGTATPGGGPSKLLKRLIECAHYGGAVYRIAEPDLAPPGHGLHLLASTAPRPLVRAAYADDSVPNRVYNASMGELHTIRGDHRGRSSRPRAARSTWRSPRRTR